jgi:hypothetical protein
MPQTLTKAELKEKLEARRADLIAAGEIIPDEPPDEPTTTGVADHTNQLGHFWVQQPADHRSGQVRMHLFTGDKPFWAAVETTRNSQIRRWQQLLNKTASAFVEPRADEIKDLAERLAEIDARLTAARQSLADVRAEKNPMADLDKIINIEQSEKGLVEAIATLTDLRAKTESARQHWLAETAAKRKAELDRTAAVIQMLARAARDSWREAVLVEPLATVAGRWLAADEILRGPRLSRMVSRLLT